MTLQWLTTRANPRSPATSYDAGQRGWKLHAVETSNDSFEQSRYQRAACGMMAVHGWSLDLFIEDRCTACERITKRREFIARHKP